MILTETKEGTILSIFVKPNSPDFHITFDGEEIVVFSTEEPVRGKVNKEIIKECTKLLGAKVQIILGATSKQKTLLIEGLNKQRVEQLLKLTK